MIFWRILISKLIDIISYEVKLGEYFIKKNFSQNILIFFLRIY